mgnify:FL=1
MKHNIEMAVGTVAGFVGVATATNEIVALVSAVSAAVCAVAALVKECRKAFPVLWAKIKAAFGKDGEK